MAEHEKDQDIRIGVYTCYCGGNISESVQCEKVRELLEKQENVVVSRTNMSMCSDAGQQLIEEDIRERGVNRVVIGACAPSLHEETFRKTVSRAGLNPYLYYHVGLREQDSWVHHGDPHATEKAVVLMNTGIAKVRLMDPLEPIKLGAKKRALVIGGGVAGLNAALDIARQGIKVTLIEKTPFLGGRIAGWEEVFPTGKPAREGLHKLIQQVAQHEDIEVLTQAELTGMSGYLGDFHATVTVQSRGVAPGNDASEIVFAACPVEVDDEFNYGLTRRKAIYKPYPDCYPPEPAIDWDICIQCGECAKVNGTWIDFENKPKEVQLNVGAVVVATGFKPYEPRQGEYGYGEFPEVLTLPQMIRWMSLHKDEEQLVYNGHPVKSVGMMHCVGSRHIPGVNEPLEDGKVNDYCSRYCCTATLHLAEEIKERYPKTYLYDFYEDIRTYGRGHEEYYLQSSEDGVRFLRFHADDAPQVNPGDADAAMLVRMHDHLSNGLEIDVPVDLLVLSVGMMPNPVDDLISLLKINSGNDRFLLEVHPKLRPVETAVPGIVLAGTAQGPMNIQESVAAAKAAAAKVAILLGKGEVEIEPFVAKVNLEKCDASGKCVEVCPYEDAVAIEDVMVGGVSMPKAVVSPANCVGCGSCVSACPNQAIDVQGWTIGQYEVMLDAIAAEIPGMDELVEVPV